jgi:hypothetical protein
MTRAYIRLDPAFDERKEAYPDGPYAALIATLCLAEAQPMRGRFRSVAYLKALLGKRGRHLPYLIEHGDVEVLPDGRPYLVGWDEWQEGDWKVGERVARIRNRRGMSGVRNALGNGGDNGPTVTPTVRTKRLDLSEVSAGGDADKALTSDRASEKGLKPIGALLPGVVERLVS